MQFSNRKRENMEKCVLKIQFAKDKNNGSVAETINDGYSPISHCEMLKACFERVDEMQSSVLRHVSTCFNTEDGDVKSYTFEKHFLSTSHSSSRFPSFCLSMGPSNACLADWRRSSGIKTKRPAEMVLS